MEQHAANQPYGQSPLGMQIQGQMGMQQGGVPPTEFPILAGANGSPYQTGMQHPQYYVLSSQQQPQQQQQQPVVLVGKPLAGGTSSVQPQYAVLPQGLAQQPAAAGFSMPQLVSLPGAPSLRPQFTSFPAASGGGYPQLTGLPAAMPAGVFQPQPPPPQQSMQAMAQQQQMSFPAGLQQQMGMPQHIHTLPPIAAPSRNMTVKSEPNEDRPSSSHSANTSAGGLGSDGSPQVGSGGTPGSSGGNKSRYRGVSYDRKKAKWRVQIKVAALGKSGVSVGYFDTEEAAARAYDRAAIGLLGLDNPNLQTNFELGDYAEDPIPRLTGKTREEVKTTLKSERIKQAPRRRFTSRQRTSRFMGVGSSNRKNQWQARILVHGKVTHLGYYETEEEAARVYDRVSLALHGDHAQTNFPATNYVDEELAPYRGLDREDLQRALGVKPMDKSSRYRGVSKKKGKWEAKVMVNRRWAYRELFDSEEEAARAYDRALWRLKPREARSYVNFKDEIPADAEALAAAAGDYQRAAASDGDYADSDGFGDDMSDGGDFEYEYRPTKGTSRTASMRAKQRSGSAPNLAASVAAAAAAAAAAAPPANRVDATAAPAFVSLPGGGLQLQYGSGGPPPPGMIPNPGSSTSLPEEPLLIRVGSETHVLPKASRPASNQVLGKRSGLQRIQSEPQFSVAARESSDFLTLPGVGDINDLMDDRDLFRGLELPDLGAVADGGTGDVAADMELQSLSDFMQGGPLGGTSTEHKPSNGDAHLTGLLFEDEELALANLEFERPRKMSKSVSMSQLSELAMQEGAGEAPMEKSFSGNAVHAAGRPPLPPGAGQRDPRLGPLGQPIRRINTFTTSLPSFEEEKPANLHMPSQHSSEEDLVRQLLGGHAAGPVDEGLHLLSDS